MEDEKQVESFTLILHSGNAKSSAMEAIRAANQKDYELAEKKLQEASEELTIAHQMQTNLLTKMSRGEEVKVDILMVHAQDHLSSAILVNDLAKQLIAMEKEIQELKAVIHGQKEN